MTTQELIERLRDIAEKYPRNPLSPTLIESADALERMHKALEEIAANDPEGFDASIARRALNRG